MINLKNVLLELFIQQEENSLHNQQEIDEPRFSDCFNSYESETMMVEQMATLDSKDNSSVLSAFENSAVYGGCDIYLGYQYCV